LTQEQAALRAGCSQPHVSKLVRRGLLDEHMIDGRLLESAVEVIRAQGAKRERVSEEDADLERRLAIAETRLKEAQAQLRELELERESGRFVELSLVEQDASDARERILTVLRAIPQRTATQVDGALEAPQARRAAVIEKLISDEVERAIAELAEAKYGG
jgi:phage terminase Nu1 subunit (DNA packaging protein)